MESEGVKRAWRFRVNSGGTPINSCMQASSMHRNLHAASHMDKQINLCVIGRVPAGVRCFFPRQAVQAFWFTREVLFSPPRPSGWECYVSDSTARTCEYVVDWEASRFFERINFQEATAEFLYSLRGYG